MITHSRETYQPTSIMRWENGVFLMAHLGMAQLLNMKRTRHGSTNITYDPRGVFHFAHPTRIQGKVNCLCRYNELDNYS